MVEGLEGLVDRIEANPGRFIRQQDQDVHEFQVDIGRLTDSLPEAMRFEDLTGILKLALLTESATETYGATIQKCAEDSGAAWLARFNARVWVPDEETHYLPYKKILLQLGFEEAELDREIRDTRERHYVHYGGSEPIHMTTFAMIQEFLTDTYHGLIANLLQPAAPLCAAKVLEVKRRETLHAVWYREMTAIQVAGNPEYVRQVAEQACQFEMPSLSLVPHLHQESTRWQELMGVEPEKVIRQLVRYFHEALGDAQLTGEMIVRLAASNQVQLGPLSAAQLQRILTRLGGSGYALVGEALLERMGLSYLFQRANPTSEGRIRSLLRSWLASHLPDPVSIAVNRPSPAA